MKILKFQSQEEVARAIKEALLRQLIESKKHAITAFLPTGQSPKALYKLLRDDLHLWKSRLIPIQIDEFVQPEQIFYRELKLEILEPLKLESAALTWDPTWSNIQGMHHVEEINKMNVDLALLGVGPNGHIGFHEPSYPQSFIGGRLFISDETRVRVPGAHTREVFTFGAGAFLKCKNIILVILGEGKREIFKKFCNFEPTEEIPVTLLKKHPSLTVYTDLSL